MPPILAFLFAKLTEIGAEQRISRAYKRAQDELAFWKAFVELEAGLCPPDQVDEMRRLARCEVECIRARVLALRAPHVTKVPASKVRKMLLLYAGSTPSAWAGRLAFYAMTVYGLILFAELIVNRDIRTFTLFSIACSLVLVVFVLALWSRRIAVRADGQRGG